MRLRAALALCATMLLAAHAPAEHAPRLHVASIDELPRPLPAPYDAAADAQAAVRTALARAKASGKPLLIDFGANWCADCRVLAGVLELPELRSYVARNFVLVQVDVGRFDRNLDIVERFGFKELKAVPALFVVDSKTGRLRNASDVLALGDARTMKPQEIADWLARWTK